MYLVQGELQEHVLRCWLSYSCIELLAGVFQDVEGRKMAYSGEDVTDKVARTPLSS